MISSIVQWYVRLPYLVRRVAERSLLSSVLLYLISQFATYWYVLKYGARLPLEGVPFLSVMAVTAGITLAIISTFTLILEPLGSNASSVGVSLMDDTLTRAARIYMRALSKIFGREISEDIVKRVILLLRFVLPMYVVLALAAAFTAFLNQDNTDILVRIKKTLLDILSDTNPILSLISVTLSITLFFASFAVFGRISTYVIRLVSFVIYMISILMMGYFMLGPLFDQILRSTKYGGGIEVEFKMRDSNVKSRGNLFLISVSNTTVWSKSDRQFMIIDNSNLSYMKFEQSPNFTMPPTRDASEAFAGQ